MLYNRYKVVEQRGAYFAGVLQENCAYKELYKVELIQEMIFLPDFQDFEGDED